MTGLTTRVTSQRTAATRCTARFSSGGNPVAVDLSVVTAGQGTEDQTLESVGTFTGPATGGWNTMQFFPLKDADGNLATVGLSGQSDGSLDDTSGQRGHELPGLCSSGGGRRCRCASAECREQRGRNGHRDV